MKKKYLVFTILSISLCYQFLSGQETQNIIASGTVYNKEDGKPLGYVQMVSYNTHLSYTSESDGGFRISLSKGDSIRIVSMGFEPKTIKAVEFLIRNKTDSVFLSPATYMLREVTVRAEEQKIHLNLPGNIGKNVDPDAEPDRSVPAPSIGMILSPVSLAHSIFSKEAKNQRRSQKIIEHLNEMSAWEEVISSGMLRDWIEIEEDQLENFIIYCNQNIKSSPDDNLLTLRNKVLNLWEDYNKK
jgi:hypothetical protein